MHHSKLIALAVSAAALSLSSVACAREQLRIVGSSTVFPFVTAAAEQFGQGGDFKTPIVESTGTGGGFKLFCEGVGENKPDINNASRRILGSEKELCQKNGVTEIIEVPIGYDGIVIANQKGATALNFTVKQLFLGLARELPDKDGKMVKNPNLSWKQVDASLPDQAIGVYGPPPTSGTRDAFVELVMEKGCAQIPAFATKYPDEKERKKACQLLREDGKYIDSGEDDNVIVQKLVADNRMLGILGYSYFEANAAKIQAAKIEGVAPDFNSIESGKYGISRSLYVYVKKQHIGQVPGIAEFIKELTSDGALGSNGYMTARGLLPLKEAERKAAQQTAKQLSAK